MNHYHYFRKMLIKMGTRSRPPWVPMPGLSTVRKKSLAQMPTNSDPNGGWILNTKVTYVREHTTTLVGVAKIGNIGLLTEVSLPERYFFSFGGGSRTCLGKSMTLIILYGQICFWVCVDRFGSRKNADSISVLVVTDIVWLEMSKVCKPLKSAPDRRGCMPKCLSRGVRANLFPTFNNSFFPRCSCTMISSWWTQRVLCR